MLAKNTKRLPIAHAPRCDRGPCTCGPKRIIVRVPVRATRAASGLGRRRSGILEEGLHVGADHLMSCAFRASPANQRTPHTEWGHGLGGLRRARGAGRWLRARGSGTGRAGSSRQRAQRGARSGAGGHEAGTTCPRVCVRACLQQRDLRGSAAEGLDLAVPVHNLDVGQHLDAQAWQGRRAADRQRGRGSPQHPRQSDARPMPRPLPGCRAARSRQASP